MDYGRNNAINIISLVVTIAALIIPIVSFILIAPEDIRIQSLVLFGIIVISIIVISIYYFIYTGYRNMLRDINNSKREIFEIKKSLNFHDLFNKMDVRLRVLERLLEKKVRNRKGQSIDPRIIWIIILLILLYLFLKSINVLP